MVVMYDGFLTVEVFYEGLFLPNPLVYTNGLHKTVTDVDFAGLDFDKLREFIKRLCKDFHSNFYYCVHGQGLAVGLRVLNSDLDYAEFINLGYMNDKRIGLYLDPYHEPLLEWIRNEKAEDVIELSEPDLGDDEFQDEPIVQPEPVVEAHLLEAEIEPGPELPLDLVPENELVTPCNRTIRDPFLNKLYSRSIIVDVEHEPVVDNDDDTRSLDDEYYDKDSEFSIKKGIVYPMHDPNQPWNIMQPILGMRFESPVDLKFCLTNYAVANGFQLGYQKNEYKCILCVCGEKARTLHKGKSKKAKVNGEPIEGEKVVGKPIKFCPFRLWASWMGSEHSYQIKSLNPNHTCSRKYGLGSLVTYVWIAKHYATEVIENPHITVRRLQADVKKKFNIKVSRNQCRNAKNKALYDLEGGLNEHYAKLRDYAYEIIRTNPGSTVKLSVNDMPDGTAYFSRFYVCYKAVRDGWKDGCRRVVGLDGTFLRGPVQGELLTAIGRDANNQIYPIAWAVVSVENKDNWEWFVELLMEDLDTEDGQELTLISDQHKGLVEAVKEKAPYAEHRQCARHIYANFKKKFTGPYYRRLFWQAAMSSTESGFLRTMEEIKAIDASAYNHLMERNPKSWCRAFQESERCCAAIENGIPESFNSVITAAREKVIITMLEEIRLYMKERIWNKYNFALNLEDDICPSIRKQLNILKKQQRYWTALQGGAYDFEVVNGRQSFCVDTQQKTCNCRIWQLTGIPCVHAMAALGHLNEEPDMFVSDWYSKEKWVASYSHHMRSQSGSDMWKKVDGVIPLPPKSRKMPGRQKKKRVRHPSEKDYGNQHVSRVGRTMTCKKCWTKGHNKSSCTSDPKDPPPKIVRKIGRPKNKPTEQGCVKSASTRGSSSGSASVRGGSIGSASTRGVSLRGGRFGSANSTGGRVGSASVRGGSSGSSSTRGGSLRGGRCVSVNIRGGGLRAASVRGGTFKIASMMAANPHEQQNTSSCVEEGEQQPMKKRKKFESIANIYFGQ